MAARLVSQRNLRRGDGHREDTLRCLRRRGRIRLHHGAWFTGNEVCGIHSSSRCSRAQLANWEGWQAPALPEFNLNSGRRWPCLLTQYFTTQESQRTRFRRLSRRFEYPPEKYPLRGIDTRMSACRGSGIETTVRNADPEFLGLTVF